MENKVKAFTIMEVLVSMVLFSLLNIAALYAWELCSIQFSQYKKTTDELHENQAFIQVLKRDIENCELAERTENLFLLNYPKNWIEYDFQQNMVLRTNSLQPNFVDTFKINLTPNWTSLNGDKKTSIFNKGQLDLKVFGKVYPILIEKKYTALDYFKK